MAHDYTVWFLNNNSQMLLNSITLQVHDGNGNNLYRYQNGKLYTLSGNVSLTIQPNGRIINKTGNQVGFINNYQGFLKDIQTNTSASSQNISDTWVNASTGKPVFGKKEKKSHKGLLFFIVAIVAVVLLSGNRSGNKTNNNQTAKNGATQTKHTTVTLAPAVLNTVIPLPQRSENDWLTPGSIYEHYILNGRDCGMNGKMKGKINLICVFVNDSQSYWSDAAIDEILRGVWKDVSYLEKQAVRYGTSLKFSVAKECLTVPASQEGRWLDYLLETRYNSPSHNLAEVESQFSQVGKYNECPFLFYFNKPGRCYCQMATRPDYTGIAEYAVYYPSTMDDERSAAHELYHIFGAVDMYYPNSVKQAAQKYFPKSSMLVGRREIDDLTAYLIGWTDSYSKSARAFMNQVAGVTREEVNAALKKELGN
jgi:hypothetical protein